MGNSSQICKSDTRVNTGLEGDVPNPGIKGGANNVFKMTKMLAKETENEILLYPSRTIQSNMNLNETNEQFELNNLPSEGNLDLAMSSVKNIVKDSNEGKDSPNGMQNKFPFEKLKRGITFSPDPQASREEFQSINSQTPDKKVLASKQTEIKNSLLTKDSASNLNSAETYKIGGVFFTPERLSNQSNGKSSSGNAEYVYRTPNPRINPMNYGETTTLKGSTEVSGVKHLENLNSNQIDWLNKMYKIREEETRFLKEHEDYLEKTLSNIKQRENLTQSLLNRKASSNSSIDGSANTKKDRSNVSFKDKTKNEHERSHANIQKVAFNPYADSMVRTELLGKKDRPLKIGVNNPRVQDFAILNTSKTDVSSKGKDLSNKQSNLKVEDQIKKIDEFMVQSKGRLSEFDKDDKGKSLKPRMMASSERASSNFSETVTSPYFKCQDDEKGKKLLANSKESVEKATEKVFVDSGEGVIVGNKQSPFINVHGAISEVASTKDRGTSKNLINNISSEEEILRELDSEIHSNINKPYEQKKAFLSRNDLATEFFQDLNSEKGEPQKIFDTDLFESEENKNEGPEGGRKWVKNELEEILSNKKAANYRNEELRRRGIPEKDFPQDTNLLEGPSLWKKSTKGNSAEEIEKAKGEPKINLGKSLDFDGKGDLSKYFKYLLIFYIVMTILFSIYKIIGWSFGEEVKGKEIVNQLV